MFSVLFVISTLGMLRNLWMVGGRGDVHQPRALGSIVSGSQTLKSMTTQHNLLQRLILPALDLIFKGVAVKRWFVALQDIIYYRMESPQSLTKACPINPRVSLRLPLVLSGFHLVCFAEPHLLPNIKPFAGIEFLQKASLDRFLTDWAFC